MQETVAKRKKPKVVENPYQQKSFPNVPRLVLLSILFGIPTLYVIQNNGIQLKSSKDDSSISSPQSRSRWLDEVPSSLSSFSNDPDYIDPNLKTMTFTLPGETEERTHEVYVQPDISTFYNEPAKMSDRRPIQMQFQGQAGKFINLSPRYLTLYWDDGRAGVHIADMPPFQAVGTATFPIHKFFLASKSNPQDIVQRIHIHRDTSLYIYDGFELGHHKLEDLSENEIQLYTLQKNNLAFADTYRSFTGRDWLSLYPHRHQPMYKMWNADYFGQQHWVTTRENHYIIEPPGDVLTPLDTDELHRDRKVDFDPRNMRKYRAKDEVLNMTMTVLSCAPRVFEIENFLSQAEVDHIVHMATGMKLSLSTTSGSDGNDRRSDTKTRTSKNSWVARKRSPIMDSIYSRAADLMMIDEALLRSRNKSELPEVHHKGTNAEEFQLVHYAESEQYTPHHDFSYPNSKRQGQPARFATLLLYLNEGMLGGETTFPRWLNSESKEKLKVVPKVGKAILFYDQLPDGNMDDLSQHAAEPVKRGEKWLINLWTWDPSFR